MSKKLNHPCALREKKTIKASSRTGMSQALDLGQAMIMKSPHLLANRFLARKSWLDSINARKKAIGKKIIPAIKILCKVEALLS